MRKRQIKKWISRYIKPELAGLRVTDRLNNVLETETSGEMVAVCTNHSIVDGWIKPEGCRPRRDYNIRQAIKRTGKTIREIKETHKYVLLRCRPEAYVKGFYMRLITE